MKQKILLGGYTSRLNKGIAEITLNTESKALVDYRLQTEIAKPTYLLVKDNAIYTCMQDGELGGIAKIADGEVVKSLQLSKASPCHISYDQKREVFYLSNYHEGLLFVVKEVKNGFVEVDRVAHEGSSVHPNQEKSHIHFAQISPCGRFLFVCDLGTDEVYLYEPQENGELKEHSRFHTPAGFGPRHLTFHPEKPLVYVLGELSNQVIVLEMNSESGELTQKQQISMLPENFKEFSAGAAIRITSDGKYLYASNRGHNSMVIYAVGKEGSLQILAHIPSYGDFPRDFALDESEEFLVVAHQNSDNLTLFARNKETGNLSLCEKEIAAPECVCVCFTQE